MDALSSRTDPGSLRSEMAERALDPGWLPGCSIRLYRRDMYRVAGWARESLPAISRRAAS
jgi:hypothetical protein